MTAQDLDMDFQLITDSQDIKETLEYIGREDEFDDWGALFVKVGDGDYEEVYGTTTSVPRDNSKVTKLFPKNTNEGVRSRKRKLLENYVRKTVRRMLKEEDVSTGNPSDPKVIRALRKIVQTGQYGSVTDPVTGKKVKVDVFSASAVVQIYDALGDQNKEKYASMQLKAMINFAFKHTR